MAFTGIPAEAFDFYAGLAVDNTKSYWNDHRDQYEECVRTPLLELGQELAPQFGEPKLFRPYRDVRFSKDKSPIKDHQGMYVLLSGGVGWYVQISEVGLMVAGGWYESAPNQVAAYRQAVEADEARNLDRLGRELTKRGFQLSGDRLKSRPRGVAPDHPQLEWLRYRTLFAERRWEPAAWMGTRRVVSRVRDSWQHLTPLMQWLADHIPPPQGRDER